ncbi:MAG: citrate synthase [Allobaculum sp.]|nr:citrate synthase [Allobaculum sp.]
MSRSLKEVYVENTPDNSIAPELYSQYRVKAGLRNENGTGVKVGLTRICDVVGYDLVDDQKLPKEGELIYRGYSLRDLVALEKRDLKIRGYEIAAFLLIFGKLPTLPELEEFQYVLKHDFSNSLVFETYRTQNLLNAMQIEVLKLYGQDENPDNDTLEDRMMKGLCVLSSLPLFVFSVYSKQKISSYPLPAAGFAENVLWMARDHQPYSKQEARVLDVLMMVHADHGGGNNSTFADVVISSTGTDIYSCISAAIGSLKGPKHGGAAGKVGSQTQMLLQSLTPQASDEELRQLCEDILDKKIGDGSGLIYGIGHAIYTQSDPRCLLIKEEVRTLAQEKDELETFEMLERFEKMACQVMKERKGKVVCANVDYYSGFAYHLLGIDQSLYTPLFAISRCAGWIAHHLENRQNNRKLIRPANIYVGEKYTIDTNPLFKED